MRFGSESWGSVIAEWTRVTLCGLLGSSTQTVFGNSEKPKTVIFLRFPVT